MKLSLSALFLIVLLASISAVQASQSPFSQLSRTDAVDTFDWLSMEKQRERNPTSTQAEHIVQRNLGFILGPETSFSEVTWQGVDAKTLDELLETHITSAPVTPTLRRLLIDFLTTQPPSSVSEQEALMGVQMKHLMRLGYLRAAVDYYAASIIHNKNDEFHKYGLMAFNFMGVDKADCIVARARGKAAKNCGNKKAAKPDPAYSESHAIGQLLQARHVQANRADVRRLMPILSSEDLRQLAQKLDTKKDTESDLSLFKQSTETDLSAEKLALFERVMRNQPVANTEIAALFMPQMKKMRPRTEFENQAPLMIVYFLMNDELPRAKVWLEEFNEALDWPDEIKKTLSSARDIYVLQEKNPSFFIFFSLLWKNIMLKEYGQLDRIVYHHYDTLVAHLLKTEGNQTDNPDDEETWQDKAKADEKLKKLPLALIEEAKTSQGTSRKSGAINANIALLSIAALVQAEKLNLTPEQMGWVLQILKSEISPAVEMNRAFAVGREVTLKNAAWN